MIEMFRLIQPENAHRAKTHAGIHYMHEGGQKSLCGGVRVFKVVDGVKMRIWYQTKRPVTCKSCIRKLFLIVREEMADLNGDQLEDIRQHVETFHRGYGNGHAPSGR